MMYIKPLINKLTNDKDVIDTVNKMKTDKETLEYLVNVISMDKIEEVFNHHYGIKYIHLKDIPIDNKVMKAFDLKTLRKNSIIPFMYEENSSTYYFAISNIIDRDIRETIKKICEANNQKAMFFFAFKYEIDDRYLEFANMNSGAKQSKMINEDENFNASDWVNRIIQSGIELDASDIHIERLENELQIRYRVDGLLTNKTKYRISENSISNVYVRLKIISDMDIVEKRKSQDGRIDNYEYQGELYDLRVSTINTLHGEKFVLRIFDKSDEIPSFSSLGFTKENTEKVLSMLSNKNGIIYLAGATGSGKTTTLYSMIEELNEDHVNIYTIENPIEKTIENINQIQVGRSSGTDYPTILKALLRQDPDVIIVGEIRDAETAALSIRASLTGHLVISTMHANNSVDSISRLADMGIESYLMGASSIGFLSQRLVRVLCPHCKAKRDNLKKHEELWIREFVDDFDYEVSKKEGNYIYESVGCDKCVDGYKGRIAIIEVLEIDDNLRSMISQKAEISEIKKYVTDRNYKTLEYDGINKVLNGITSINELMGKL